MFDVTFGRSQLRCDGFQRRSFLRLGLTGIASVSLPQLARARNSAGTSGKKTSIILIWLDGGPGHMDTYDMKPDAPEQYRGLWTPVPTNVPGIEITELFPHQAKCADKFSIVRSLHHNQGDHFTAAHCILTGRAGVSGASTPSKSPFIGSILTRMTGARNSGMPPYVAVPYASSVGLRPGYFGAHYVGAAYNPFETGGDPNGAKFQVSNLELSGGLSMERLESRVALSQQLDRFARESDQRHTAESMDQFDHQAVDLVTGPRARAAFDLSTEKEEVRNRYGRDTLGQSMLLARRLVEAGTTLVTVHSGGWDHHWDLKTGMETRLPPVDQGISALLADLADRGMSDDVLVMLCGEFSRTPRMNDGGNGGAPMSMGTPGRDHWGNAMFCLMGGGGVKGGRIIGSTNRIGEHPVDRPITPADIHHTMFHVLGVDPEIAFADHRGRPTAALEPGAVIHELL